MIALTNEQIKDLEIEIEIEDKKLGEQRALVQSLKSKLREDIMLKSSTRK